MIFDQKQLGATKHSRSYGTKQAVEFWAKIATLERRIIGEEA